MDINTFHEKSPFDGFDHTAYPDDVQGWYSDHASFERAIEAVRPKLIIEVGTWKGGSALHMASLLKKHGLSESKIVCVDTWLGSVEFWIDKSDKDRYKSLHLKNGYPSVYYQFLANVCRHKHEDIIIPLPQTGSTAAILFKHFGVKADLIYIDGSHVEEDVYRDLKDYVGVLSRSGVILGDDYGMPEVKRAAIKFAREQKMRLEDVGGKFVLRHH